MASHMDGISERQIRSARNILASLLRTHSSSFDEESLNTLFTEVEAILNSRPLVVETISDVNNKVALSPSHLLLLVHLENLICTAEGVGEGYSIYVTNFGRDSVRNF